MRLPEATLVVVFDAGKARFFAEDGDGRLRESREIASNLPSFTRDIVSDKPGRAFASVGGVRHAYESQHDPRKYEKHEFVHAIARMLDHTLDQDGVRHIVLVAPKRSLGEFRSLAAERLKRVILREIPKDFANLPEHEIDERIGEFL